ncbi:penicillin-binding protein 2 [Desulfocurvibacter africanus]|uniref:penicillin-binding protein 2 n=1 Tax=Desulfocurvibacter africanus TaxID=873 RepID=UPI002FDB028F
MSVAYEPEGQQPPRHGLILLQALIMALFCAFALRLWYLQVHKGEQFAQKARENRLRQEFVYAPRGLIYDRDGVLVAVNEPAYALGLIREDVADIEKTLAQVSEWTGQDIAELRAAYRQGRKKVKPFDRIILAPNISFDLLSSIEAGSHRWPGLEIMVRPRRNYPQGPLLSQILGYVAEANDEEITRDPDLQLADTVGKQGLEYVLESQLRGRKGLRQMEVDASGRLLNERQVSQPSSGQSVTMAIDLDLQQFATEEMEKLGHAGAVVVMEPFTGQVLAMVSTPTFDNNAFASGLSTEQWAALRDDPRHPLQNKATQGVYPPGSTFKLLVALAGLHEGIIDPSETVFCGGEMKLGRRVFRCWNKHGHGRVDLKRGLVESCDVYFYEMGNRLGVDRMEAFAKASGFGSTTGIDLPHEKGGLIPSRNWKLQRFGERWQGGENLNFAIGQGYTLVSPLQLARFVSSLLNGGFLLKPLLVDSDEPVVQGRLLATAQQIKMVLDTMVATVDMDRGTARRLRRPDARMGGKTGTAQVVKLKTEDRGKKTEEIAYEFRDHAWLVSWGVKDGRAVVIVCLVEHGGHGGEAAGPVSRAIYDYLFGPLGGTSTTMENWPYVAGVEPNPLEKYAIPLQIVPKTAAKAGKTGKSGKLAAPKSMTQPVGLVSADTTEGANSVSR